MRLSATRITVFKIVLLSGVCLIAVSYLASDFYSKGGSGDASAPLIQSMDLSSSNTHEYFDGSVGEVGQSVSQVTQVTISGSDLIEVSRRMRDVKFEPFVSARSPQINVSNQAVLVSRTAYKLSLASLASVDLRLAYKGIEVGDTEPLVVLSGSGEKQKMQVEVIDDALLVSASELGIASGNYIIEVGYQQTKKLPPRRFLMAAYTEKQPEN